MRHKLREWFTLQHTLALGAGVVFVVLGLVVIWVATLRIPDLNTFDERIVLQSTKIYDRTGEVLLFDVHEDVQRTVVPGEDISHHIKNATIAIEDTEFYEHYGIKPKAILRAILVNVTSIGFAQGGSTITQQVVKNSILTSEKTIARKLKEWALSLRLEQELSKEEILTLYLNESPYGGNIYGVEEASMVFFGKSADEVTLAEAAYLAALPQAPTYFSPYGSHVEELTARKNTVLARMLESGFITQEVYEEARNEVVVFHPRPESRLKAPHFVMHIREYLEAQYGPRALEEDGLRVITTLDYELQKQAEEIVKKHALTNAENFNAENASLVAVDPNNGQILVMVGSRDYFDPEIDGAFNVSLAHRQPGSAFKPIVYATALAEGYTPDTILFDVPTEFSTQCSAESIPESSGAVCYTPQNYDNTFRGPMTLRDALAQSVNVPAVKILYLAGLDASLRTARALGIQGLTDIAQYGLTLVLGGGEVTPLEMAGAYSVFANGGTRYPITSILSVEDVHGKELESFSPQPTRVLNEQVAHQMSDILSDNVARTPAFGANSYLHFSSHDVAAKTGTTNDFRDAWIVGYTPTISVAAWAGNNNNSPMEKKVAGFIIAPLWNEFMNVFLSTRTTSPFPTPRESANKADLKPILRGVWHGGESYTIDTVSGKLATEYTPPETQEELVIPNIHSILYWVDKENPHGTAIPGNASKDPQFRLWEPAVRSWAEHNGFPTNSATTTLTVTAFDDVHIPEHFPEINLKTSSSQKTYDENDTLRLNITHTSEYPLETIEVYLNGRYVMQEDARSRTITLTLQEQENLIFGGENTLRVVGIDEVYNRGEATLSFMLEE